MVVVTAGMGITNILKDELIKQGVSEKKKQINISSLWINRDCCLMIWMI